VEDGAGADEGDQVRCVDRASGFERPQSACKPSPVRQRAILAPFATLVLKRTVAKVLSIVIWSTEVVDASDLVIYVVEVVSDAAVRPASVEDRREPIVTELRRASW
jgi:hypothetical protein